MPKFNGTLDINGTKLTVEVDTSDTGEIYLGADNAGIDGDNSLGFKNNAGILQFKQKTGDWFNVLNPPSLTIDGQLTMGGNIIPTANDSMEIGSDTNRVKKIWMASEIDATGDLTINSTGNIVLNEEIFQNGLVREP
jgi:hypothetical protein